MGEGVLLQFREHLPVTENTPMLTMGEGDTPLVRSRRLGDELGVGALYFKLEGCNPTGSFKDRGMTVGITRAVQLGARAVACASTGDTSAALSAYAAAAGIPATVFLPRGKISPAQLIQLVANGAIVFALDTDFDGCMDIVKQVAEKDGVYLANSMNSLRIEGQKTVGLEIAQQLDWSMPDWIVIPGGNLGNVSALAKGLDMLVELGLISKRPRIWVGQAEAANPLYLAYQKDFEVFEPIAARKTVASAIQIGNPVSYQKAVDALRRYDGVVEQATETEIMEECARADRTGLFNCPHTGVALVALRKLQARGLVHSSDQVVVISTAHGLKFVDSKLAYHTMELDGIISEHPNPPIEMAADYQAVRDQMLREIDQRFGS